MKKIFSFSAALLLMCGMAGVYSCGNGGEEGNQGVIPTAPIGLEFDDVTDSEATLMWVAAEGVTDYEVVVKDGDGVVIGDGNPIPVAATTYTVEGLDPSTKYSWQVRSKVGGNVSAWATGSVFQTAKPAIPAPTNLTVESTSGVEGSFSWSAAEGIDDYQIRFNTGRNRDVTGTTYTVSDLAPKTEYEWEVRSKVGKSYSAWVAGPGFETEAERMEINLVTAAAIYKGAANYVQTPGMSEFVIQFTEYQTGAIRTGYMLMVDFVTPAVSQISRLMDIPEGTYTIVEEIPGAETGETIPTNSILPIFDNGLGTVLGYFDNGRQTELLFPIGGTMTVSGNRDNYTIDIEFVFGERGETIVSARWTGPMRTSNNNVSSTFDEDIDFGVITNVTEDYLQNPLGDGSLDAYMYTVIGGTLAPSGQTYVGSGWLIYAQIVTAINSGGTIPGGVYPIDTVIAPGHATGGYISEGGGLAGLWLQKIENDRLVGRAPVVSGKVTVSGQTFTVEGKDDAGNNVTGTFLKVPAVPAPLRAAAGSHDAPLWRPFASEVNALRPVDLRELEVR